MILDMAFEFEMGLKFKNSLELRESFNFGFTMACLSCVGVCPDLRDMLTISVSILEEVYLYSCIGLMLE